MHITRLDSSLFCALSLYFYSKLKRFIVQLVVFHLKFYLKKCHNESTILRPLSTLRRRQLSNFAYRHEPGLHIEYIQSYLETENSVDKAAKATR